MESIVRLKFKVNIYSLISESRYIRSQEKKSLSDVNRGYLYKHRTRVVREEIRITNLAYGFCKNTPYSKMESKTNNPLTPDQIYKIWLKIKRKGVDVDRSLVKEWIKT